MRNSSSSIKFKSLAVALTVLFHVGLFAFITFDGKNTFWLEYMPDSIQDLLVEPEQDDNDEDIIRP